MATPEDILKTHRSFHQRLIKNREYFFSEKFEKILSKQILQIKV
jgi:hypothetical protein